MPRQLFPRSVQQRLKARTLLVEPPSKRTATGAESFGHRVYRGVPAPNHVTTTENVGKAMIAAAGRGSDVPRLTNRDINALAGAT